MIRHEHTKECGFCDKTLKFLLTWGLPFVVAGSVGYLAFVVWSL